MGLRRLRTLRAQVWLSCSYWWYFAAVGCFGPYITLYYRDLQLSGIEIGVLTAILPLGVAFIAPVWGMLADARSAHRLILRGALLSAALTALLLTRATSFVALAPLIMLLAICLAAIPALLDSYALTISEREGVSFGQMRVWGSLGFIAAVWLVAWRMGQHVSSFFLFAYAAALLLGAVVTLGLPHLRPRALQPTSRGGSAIIKDRSVVTLLLCVFLVTSNATFISSYLSIYLTEVGGSTRLVGTASALGALSEVPLMVLGRRLIDRFNSRNIFVLAVGAYLLRFALYSIPPTAPLALPIQLLHGLSFGLYLMASVTLIHELAGRERAATAQGLLTSTSLGFGAITGSLAGGALLDRIGAVGIFRVGTVGMLVALGICLVSVRTISAAHADEPDGLSSSPDERRDRRLNDRT
jgi:PPP family 3-phenylpropionic acid transporter